MKDGFVRQRRNLIAFSIALLFIESSKITFEKINVLGNEFSVGDPVAINIGLWVALLYFLIRYYQYSHDLEECQLGPFYGTTLRKYVEVAALKKALKQKRVKRRTKIENEIIEYSIDNMQVFSMGPAWKIKVDLCKFEDKGTSKSITTSQNYEIDLNSKEMLIPRIKSFVKTSLHTTYFTEYVLPFIIFLIPVIYKIKSVI